MSSKKVTFIVGLYGSGKTHFLKSHSAEFEGAYILDDPSVTQERAILDIAITHDRVAIADPMLCMVSRQILAKKIFKDYEQEWVFFENDEAACWDNVRLRDDGRTVSKYCLAALSALYSIPEGVEALSVFKRR